MKSPVDYTKEGAIGVITVNNPPVNALSVGVPPGILEALEQGLADPAVKAFVLMGAGSTFIAGADIRELEKLADPDGPTLRDLLPRLEGSAKPVIVAIHGTALGGGLETALGCHFRCAVPSAKFGLPEVKLGLLPGAGGTQRLPRLIGVKPALEMILSGKFVSAEEALTLGLIDEILEGELLPAALEFASRIIAEERQLRLISQMKVPLAADRDSGYFREVRQSLENKAKGQLAPFLIVDCVEAAATIPFAEGWRKEEKLFWQCANSPQSQELIQAFFAERGAKKAAPGAQKAAV